MKLAFSGVNAWKFTIKSCRKKADITPKFIHAIMHKNENIKLV